MNAVITAWSWDWRRLGEQSITIPDAEAAAALAGSAHAHLLLSAACEEFARSFHGEKDFHTSITDRHVEDHEIDELRARHSKGGPDLVQWGLPLVRNRAHVARRSSGHHLQRLRSAARPAAG